MAFEDECLEYLTLPCDPGEVVQKTFVINASERFIKTLIVNEDANYAITDITILAAPLGNEELHDEEMVNYDWS